jgi:hypothetical protein
MPGGQKLGRCGQLGIAAAMATVGLTASPTGAAWPLLRMRSGRLRVFIVVTPSSRFA